jgi:hypothetical protein
MLAGWPVGRFGWLAGAVVLMARNQKAAVLARVDKKVKRGFGCMVRELIAWIVPVSPTAPDILRQTLLGPCRKMRTTSVQRTPPLQVYAPYATATHLNAVYFLDPYPTRPRCNRKTVAFFSGCAWPGGTALGLLACAAVLSASAACWTDSANARGASFREGGYLAQFFVGRLRWVWPRLTQWSWASAVGVVCRRS